MAGGADLWRNGLTVAFQILTQVAFALLLVAGFGLARLRGRGRLDRAALLTGAGRLHGEWFTAARADPGTGRPSPSRPRPGP